MTSQRPPKIVPIHIGHPVEEANALQSRITRLQEQLESLKKELEKLQESVYNRFKGAYDNFDFENDAEDILDAMDYFSQNFAGLSQAGGWGWVFGRSVNPISTRGGTLSLPSTTSPQDFQSLRRPCLMIV